LPQLCREKSKYSEPYAAIEPVEIDKAGLPPPPEKDAYLKSRVEKFMLEVRGCFDGRVVGMGWDGMGWVGLGSEERGRGGKFLTERLWCVRAIRWS
jgi:hypothetical protein